MKNLVLILMVGCIYTSCYAQDEPLNYKIALKMYNLTRVQSSVIQPTFPGNPATITTTSIQVFHPTLAVQWKGTKNNFHEIELTDFSLNKTATKSELIGPNGAAVSTTNSPDVMATNLRMRYEFTANFALSKDSKLVPGMGFSVSPYLMQVNYLPQANIEFATFERKVGAGIFVIPRLSYYLSSKLFLDLNFPVCIADGHYSTIRRENPVLPLQQRTVSTWQMESMPQYFSMRIGIGVKL